jgi:sugar phosphate isomerase/epimerase
VGNNFVVPPEEWKKQVDYVKEGLATASKLGAGRMRIFGGSPKTPEGVKPEERMSLVIDGIKACIGTAEKYGITLVLENHGGIPVSSDEVLQIIEAVASPYLKVNFDMGNFLSYTGEDPLKAAQKLYRYIDLVHIKDLKLVNGSYISCPAGDGVVPVKECLEYFINMGYEGYASLEYEGWDIMASKPGVKRSIDYLKSSVKFK